MEGNELKRLRERAGLTQQQLSRKTGSFPQPDFTMGKWGYFGICCNKKAYCRLFWSGQYAGKACAGEKAGAAAHHHE